MSSKENVLFFWNLFLLVLAFLESRLMGFSTLIWTGLALGILWTTGTTPVSRTSVWEQIWRKRLRNLRNLRFSVLISFGPSESSSESSVSEDSDELESLS